MDWMTRLTWQLEVDFRELLHQSDPDKTMTFVTSFKRFAREEGLSQGHEEGQMLALKESIRDLLEPRFGEASQEVIHRSEQESDRVVLRGWLRQAGTIDSPRAFQLVLLVER